MFINNLQVKCKTSPEQQKTSWKRPDVYKQLASQMRDLSSLNDSIYMHASQVQEKKKYMSRTAKTSQIKNEWLYRAYKSSARPVWHNGLAR